MKNINCPFCGSKTIKEIKAIISPFNQEKYNLMNCFECELRFFTPLIFENVYESETIKEYANFHKGRIIFPPWTKETISVLRNLSINLNDKKILEIGGGDGINYTALNEIYSIETKNYYVVELDSKSVEQCKARGITNIINSAFGPKTVAKIHDKFDVVLLLEVLEHQINPKEFIKLVFNLVAQNGIVVITVPNRERFFINYDEFQGDLPPHHFLRFNKTFFRKNFASSLYYLKDFSHQFKIKNLQEAALKLTSIFKVNRKGWVLFVPFIPIIKLVMGIMAKIRGEGIIVILKKNDHFQK